jgi:hypothetical protein
MTDWYKAFQLAATKAVVDVDVEAEPQKGQVGDVVEAPAVVAGGASGAFRMSPPPEEDEGGERVEDREGGEGPGTSDGDFLRDGEEAEDNVTAAAAAEACLAAYAAAIDEVLLLTANP